MACSFMPTGSLVLVLKNSTDSTSVCIMHYMHMVMQWGKSVDLHDARSNAQLELSHVGIRITSLSSFQPTLISCSSLFSQNSSNMKKGRGIQLSARECHLLLSLGAPLILSHGCMNV